MRRRRDKFVGHGRAAERACSRPSCCSGGAKLIRGRRARKVVRQCLRVCCNASGAGRQKIEASEAVSALRQAVGRGFHARPWELRAGPGKERARPRGAGAAQGKGGGAAAARARLRPRRAPKASLHGRPPIGGGGQREGPGAGAERRACTEAGAAGGARGRAHRLAGVRPGHSQVAYGGWGRGACALWLRGGASLSLLSVVWRHLGGASSTCAV